VLWVVAIPVWWIQAGYRGVPITEPFSFRAADGGCDVATEAIGNHCFSDFYSLLNDVKNRRILSDGYAIPALYPPSGLLPYVAIVNLQELLGWHPRLWLIFFLLAGTLAVSVPAIYAARRAKNQSPLLVLFALGPASLPALMVLDRGNGLMFVIPLLLAYGVYARSHQYNVAALFLALAVSQRPQFLLAFVLLIGLRQWRALFLGVAASASLLGAGFAFWPGNRIENVTNWVDTLAGYKSTHSIAYDWPANLSLSRAIYQLTQLIGVEIYRVPLYVVIGFLLVVGLACALYSKQLSFTALFTLAMFSPVLVPDLSYFYYLTVVLPLVAILITSPEERLNDRARSISHVVAVAAAVTVVPIPLANGESPAIVTPRYSAIVWLFVCLMIAISARPRSPKMSLASPTEVTARRSAAHFCDR